MRSRGWLLILFLAVLGCQNVQPAVFEPLPTPELQVVISVLDDAIAPTTTPIVLPTSAHTSTPVSAAEPSATPMPYVAGEGIYTIGWISDPQHYSAKFPAFYDSMTEFLRDEQESMRLAYVIHTGDLVNKTDSEEQWAVAVRAQANLDDIPNGVLAGNHDCQKPLLFEAYSKHFGEKKYKHKPWYGGSYQDNRGHYDLLTIGETEYLFVYMSFGPDNGCIKWLNKVFSKYPDRIAFLCLHDYFTNEQTRSADGEKLFQKVVKKNPNIRFVLCGHRYGALLVTDELDDNGDKTPDRTVYQMMFNYQAAGSQGGDGYLRLLQIDETNRTMRVLTYSPALRDFNRFDDPTLREERYDFDESAEEFVLPLPW